MVTVKSRLKYIRSTPYYLGDTVNASVANYKGEGKTIIVDITIYTKSRNKAIERIERWIVPNATIDDYLDKPAYRVYITLTTKASYFIRFPRRRRWF